MKRYFKVWLIHLKSALSQRMVYPLNFLVMIIGVALQMFLVIIFVQVFFNYTDNFAGWSRPETMVVVASYMMVEGLMWATVAMLSGVIRNINNGMLDFLLVKPINTQFMVSVWRADQEDWARVVTAIIILFFNVPLLGLSRSVLLINSVFYFILIINAYFIVYSIFLLIRTLGFWIIEARSFYMIGEVVIQSSKYPIDIFSGKFVKLFFSSLIPLAFIATIPAKILINGPKLNLILYSTLLALFFFYFSRRFFLYGLKHYESASS